jgi:hypothetical protein
LRSAPRSRLMPTTPRRLQRRCHRRVGADKYRLPPRFGQKKTRPYSDRNGSPITLDRWRVSEAFFEILGVSPALGRTFVREEAPSEIPTLIRPGSGVGVKPQQGAPALR